MSACFCRGVGSGCDNEGGDGCNSERSVITMLVSIQEETGDNYRLYGIVIGGICCIKVVAGIRIKAQPLSGFRR